MDEQEKQQWAEYARSRSIEDRNRLVERYYWLANMLAKKFYLRVAGTGLQCDELLSAANEGLIEAVERYDLSRGIAFETYAPWRITNQIKDYLRETDAHTRLYRIREPMVREWAKTLGHNPTDDEIYEHFGFKLERRTVVSISLTCVGPGEQDYKRKELAESLGTNDSNHDVGEVSYLLKGFTRRERLAVVLYCIEGYTMKDSAAVIGVSESRLSQMMKELLPRMRENFEKAA